MVGPVADPLISACTTDAAPDGITRNPATHAALETSPAYNPPSTPLDAPENVTSPCCSSSAPPSSICSIEQTVVCPSWPVPPATCKLCARTDTADPGSSTIQAEGSSSAPRYCSSIRAFRLWRKGCCERKKLLLSPSPTK